MWLSFSHFHYLSSALAFAQPVVVHPGQSGCPDYPPHWLWPVTSGVIPLAFSWSCFIATGKCWAYFPMHSTRWQGQLYFSKIGAHNSGGSHSGVTGSNCSFRLSIFPPSLSLIFRKSRGLGTNSLWLRRKAIFHIIFLMLLLKCRMSQLPHSHFHMDFWKFVNNHLGHNHHRSMCWLQILLQHLQCPHVTSHILQQASTSSSANLCSFASFTTLTNWCP